jgi:phage tail sheath protein FI
MPVFTSYPGVYVEEVPSGVRTITGVATSITAFVGRTPRGPLAPTDITSFADYERAFGGLAASFPLSYAVRDFYQNGGSRAIIVRLFEGDPAAATAGLTLGNVTLAAASPGAWGNRLRGEVKVVNDPQAKAALGVLPEDALYNLTVRDSAPGGAVEQIMNLVAPKAGNPEPARRIDKVLANESSLVRWQGDIGALDAGKIADAVDDATKKTGDVAAAAKGVTDARNAFVAGRGALEKALDDAKKAQSALQAKQPPATQAELDAAQKQVDDAQAALDHPKAVEDAEKALKDANTALAAAESAKGGKDSNALSQATYLGNADQKTGLHALRKVDLFNLLSLPPDVHGGDTPPAVYQFAMQFCAELRAMLLVDPPAAWSANRDVAATKAVAGLGDLGLTGTAARNAALYFPRLRVADPLRDGRLETIVPSGCVAGIMARTDTQRGVWKAPAGLDATLGGVAGLDAPLNDQENGLLNPLGVNVLRTFPVYGHVVWGARTLRGADQLGDEYKYVPVRRLALYIEESLFRGTKWVVFEPNDEPLWAQIRLNVGAFMHNLFRQGAFQGAAPKDAYFVKCDKETTTQNDIDLGIVNIVVGFAPLKPAEFVILKLQQIAGKLDV